jgi:hypothetical protein
VHRHRQDGPFQVIVEWKSSPEFAPVEEIDLLVGVWAQGMIDGMVYTRAYDGPIANFDNSFVQPGTGKVFVETPNIPYWYDPNPQNGLFVRPTAAEAYQGSRVFTIDPAKYPVGTGVCILSDSNTARTTTTAGTGTSSRASLLGGTTATYSTTESTTKLTTSPLIATSTGGGTTTTDSNGSVVYLKKSLDSVLEDILNGVVEPWPGCIRREFQNAKRPDRMFVRAEVRNLPAPDSSAFCDDNPLSDLQPCVRRVAYTNPVWVNVEPCTSLISCATTGTVGDFSGGLTTDGGSGGSGGSTGPVTGMLGTIVGTFSTTLQMSPTTSTTTPTPTKAVTAVTSSTATFQMLTR